jgi:hypothetical protein
MKGKVDFLFFESDISIAAFISKQTNTLDSHFQILPTGILFDAAFALLNSITLQFLSKEMLLSGNCN